MKEREIKLVNELRKDSRRSLTDLSKATDTPLSTVFKKFERLYQQGIIKKHACLIDFGMLGYPVKAGILISTHNKDEMKEFLSGHPNVNTLLRLSGDYDFYAELVFENMLRLQDFTEELEGQAIVKKTAVHFVEDVKQEEFKLGEQR
jgi:Lrp/AsnC family leucine-responsive transcriptional regulator